MVIRMKLLYFLQQLRTTLLDRLMVFITYLGSFGFIWIVIAVLFASRKGTRPIAFVMTATLLLGLLVGNGLLKNLVRSSRPAWDDEQVELLIERPKDYSFPSCHTLSSFGAATAIFLFDKKLGFLAYCLAFLIGFSRLYLFVHYLIDVIAGAIIGIVLALLVYYFYFHFNLPFLGY